MNNNKTGEGLYGSKIGKLNSKKGVLTFTTDGHTYK